MVLETGEAVANVALLQGHEEFIISGFVDALLQSTPFAAALGLIEGVAVDFADLDHRSSSQVSKSLRSSLRFLITQKKIMMPLRHRGPQTDKLFTYG